MPSTGSAPKGTYGYDLNANRVKSVNRNSQTRGIIYDELNRPIIEKLYSSEQAYISNAYPQEVLGYEYDVYGRFTHAESGAAGWLGSDCRE